jgi:hypothetical protein
MRGLIDKLTNCFEDGPGARRPARQVECGAEAGKYFSQKISFYEFKLTRKSRAEADVGRCQAFLTRRVNFTFNSRLAPRWSRSLIDFFFFFLSSFSSFSSDVR